MSQLKLFVAAGDAFNSGVFTQFNLRWKRYASRGHDIPGNLCCPLGRSILGGLLQIIVQVANDTHGQKPEDVKFLPVFSLERKYTRNVGIAILPAAFTADPEPTLTTCKKRKNNRFTVQRQQKITRPNDSNNYENTRTEKQREQ